MQECIIDPELALAIIREETDTIAYDTETTGLDIHARVIGYVVTNREYSIYVPVRHEGGGNIPRVEEFEKELTEAFAARSRYGYRTVGHHLGFDLRLSLRHGVVLGSPLEDTMINELLIDDRNTAFSLEACCIRRNVTVKKGAKMYAHLADLFGGVPDRDQMSKFYKTAGDDPVVVEYATGDGISTLELWQAQQDLLDSNEVRKPWKLECDLLPYLARMHHRGMRVDMDYAEKVMRPDGIIAESLRAAKAELPPGLNVKSPKELEALFRSNGYTDDMFSFNPPTAPGKKPSISFAEKWLSGNEIGEKVVKVRQLSNCLSSFIMPIAVNHNVNGRIHPVLNQSRSDEGGVQGARLSCSEPNMQAQPKRNKTIGKLVRPLIIPDDGFDFIEEGDFKQQEPRFFTHYSEEPKLISGYRSGTLDIHDIASHELGLDRDRAKRLGLGMLTGMGIKALAGHMGWDFATAKRHHRAFLGDAFPAIGDFQKDAIKVMAERGFVRSILGRKCRCTDKSKAYVAVSRIIQNSGGDHMKTALLRANQYEDAYPNDVQILLSIHDSTIWQRREGHDVSELKRVIENVVNEPDFNLLVPIPIDLGSGRNWSEASYSK